jgi:hypothetical protein
MTAVVYRRRRFLLFPIGGSFRCTRWNDGQDSRLDGRETFGSIDEFVLPQSIVSTLVLLHFGVILRLVLLLLWTLRRSVASPVKDWYRQVPERGIARSRQADAGSRFFGRGAVGVVTAVAAAGDLDAPHSRRIAVLVKLVKAKAGASVPLAYHGERRLFLDDDQSLSHQSKPFAFVVAVVSYYLSHIQPFFSLGCPFGLAV